MNIGFYIDAAKKSNHPKHKHATIIIHNGDIVAIANNSHHEHAEVRAINVAKILGYKTKELTLISIAITKSGKLKMAMPCPTCTTYIEKNNIKNIFYSTVSQAIVKYNPYSPTWKV